MVIEMLTPDQNPTFSQNSAIKHALGSPVEWHIFDNLTEYQKTHDLMRHTARQIAEGQANEQVWLLEHPPLYTSGTSANTADLLLPNKFPVYPAGRGGQFTYHGPGQRVAYVMLDLKQRGRDVRNLVNNLEAWIIDTLAQFNISANRSKGRVGVWVPRPELGPNRVDKIAAIGVRVSKWVSFHGISLNIAPDLSHYQGIVPCGIADQGITSFEDLGHLVAMEEVDIALRQNFQNHFGMTTTAPSSTNI